MLRLRSRTRQGIKRRIMPLYVRATGHEGYLTSIVKRLNFYNGVSSPGKSGKQCAQPTMKTGVSVFTSLSRNRSYERFEDQRHEEDTDDYQLILNFGRVV